MSGRALLRELFDLKLDTIVTVPGFGAFPSVDLPVDISPAGVQHAYYLRSVIPTESNPLVSCGEFGSGTRIEYAIGAVSVDGQRITFLVIANNYGADVEVHARVYRFRGLADS